MVFGIIEYMQGITSIIVISVAVSLAVVLFLKYPKHKEKNLIFVGIGWMGIANAYLSTAIKFILKIALNFDLPDKIHFIINNVFLPIAVFFWLVAMTDLLNTKKLVKNLILGLTILLSIIFEIIFFILLSINSTLIGKFVPGADLTVNWTLFIVLYFLIIAIVIISSAFFFSIKSILSKDPKSVLKGWLILIGFILYTVAIVLNAAFDPSILRILIERIILVASSIVLYMGFLLPKWVQRLLLK